jgi:hypothetical protein
MAMECAWQPLCIRYDPAAKLTLEACTERRPSNTGAAALDFTVLIEAVIGALRRQLTIGTKSDGKMSTPEKQKPPISRGLIGQKATLLV